MGPIVAAIDRHEGIKSKTTTRPKTFASPWPVLVLDISGGLRFAYKIHPDEIFSPFWERVAAAAAPSRCPPSGTEPTSGDPHQAMLAPSTEGTRAPRCVASVYQ